MVEDFLERGGKKGASVFPSVIEAKGGWYSGWREVKRGRELEVRGVCPLGWNERCARVSVIPRRVAPD